MKKLILLISFLILIVCTYSFKPSFADIFKESDLFFSDIKYSIYCLNIEKNLSNCRVLNIGNGYIVSCRAEDASYIKKHSSNVLGESISFKSIFTKIDKILNAYNINIIKEEKVGDIYSLYGYINKSEFNNSVTIDGNKVNVQIAFNNGIITVGTPIILGDY